MEVVLGGGGGNVRSALEAQSWFLAAPDEATAGNPGCGIFPKQWSIRWPPLCADMMIVPPCWGQARGLAIHRGSPVLKRSAWGRGWPDTFPSSPQWGCNLPLIVPDSK